MDGRSGHRSQCAARLRPRALGAVREVRIQAAPAGILGNAAQVLFRVAARAASRQSTRERIASGGRASASRRWRPTRYALYAVIGAREAAGKTSLSRLYGRRGQPAAIDAPATSALLLQRVQRDLNRVVRRDQAQRLDDDAVDDRTLEELGIAGDEKRRIRAAHHCHERLRVAELALDSRTRIGKGAVSVF